MTKPSANPCAPRRLDVVLVETGAFATRARAQAAVKAGLVRINGAVEVKPAALVAPGDPIFVEGDVHPWVSRGGVKLEAALRTFGVTPEGAVCLDLGASTGGFTDVLLSRGAKKVYAVDVGSGQLHPRITGDPRVVNLERTHARDLTRALVSEPIDIVVCDVSFISVMKALPPALSLCAPGARLLALIKPQFEVGRARIGKGGIVKPGDANGYGVAEEIAAWMSGQPGWKSLGYVESPITGGDGNREFLLGAIRPA